MFGERKYMKNKMTISFSALAENEQFARTAVAAFMMSLNPTVEAVTDVKTAVSEAVTNSIIHGYSDGDGIVTVTCEIDNGALHIEVADSGVGIKDLKSVLEPFVTSRPFDERSGMGFTIMKTFMDGFDVKSCENEGTVVYMTKIIDNAS